MSRIFTHSGNVHIDEIYACGALLYLVDKIDSIHRVNALDMSDVKVGVDYIVDIGMEFDPRLRKFDHHQREDKKECSFSLIVKNSLVLESLYEDNHAFRDIVDFITRRDNFGPFSIAKSLKISNGYFSRMFPSDYILKTSFKTNPFMTACLIRDWLKEFVDLEDTIKLALDQILESYKLINDDILYLDNKWDSRISTQDVVIAFDRFDYLQKTKDISIRVNYLSENDERNPGCRCFFRTEKGEKKYDLYLLNGQPHVKFVHRGGFLAIFDSDISEETIREYLELSLIKK